MTLTRVTITGADDEVNPADLALLSREFPFVEWAVLCSRKRAGTPRYPSERWMQRFAEVFRQEPNAHVAAHLCGQMADDTLSGDGRVVSWLQRFGVFDRVQVNGFRHANEDLNELVELSANLEWILQVRDRESVAAACYMGGCFYYSPGRVSMLWDASGGRGVFELNWPSEPMPIPIGFAGGIGPDTVAAVLAALGDGRGDFWIDMESGVRTDDHFDLTKVRKVLETAAVRKVLETAIRQEKGTRDGSPQ
jgi:hypothetical protein